MLRPAITKSIASALILLALLNLCIYFTNFGNASGTNLFFSFLKTHEPQPSATLISQNQAVPSEALPPTAIPKKFWYKAGPRGVSRQGLGWIKSCLSRNPQYLHEVLTDDTAERYVRENYSHRPDIMSTYLNLTVPILKADLLRYLILYVDGGVWNDLDAECRDTPIDAWVSEDSWGAGMIVGLEFDVASEQEMESDDIDYLRTTFATWTVMARPGSPHLLQVIENILVDIHEVARENKVEVSELTFETIPDVVDLTGPRQMTRGIIKSLENMIGEQLHSRDIGRLKEPKLIGDLLILPQIAFAAMQKFWPDPIPADLTDMQFVTHHYAGSWKSSGGETKKERKRQ